MKLKRNSGQKYVNYPKDVPVFCLIYALFEENRRSRYLWDGRENLQCIKSFVKIQAWSLNLEREIINYTFVPLIAAYNY